MAAKLALKIETGVSWTKVLTYKVKQDGIPTRVSLAGWTAKMSIKDHIDGTEILLLSTENTRILLEQNYDDEGSRIGVIFLKLTDAETLLLVDGLPSKKGVYDIKLTPPSALSIRLLQGTITLDREVTD